MGEGRIVKPGRLIGRNIGLLLLAGIVSVSGCDGDTLYDPVPADVDPPVVAVLSPANGARSRLASVFLLEFLRRMSRGYPR